jgi:hypothetical protein
MKLTAASGLALVFLGALLPLPRAEVSPANPETNAKARAILQYTDITRDPALYRFQQQPSQSERLFPQLLFSYKINPQTVFFAGYSGTRLGSTVDDVRTDLTEADRTFCVKLGYAWLF